MTPHQYQQQHQDTSALAALALLTALAALAALSAGCASAPPCVPKVVYQPYAVEVAGKLPPPPAIRPPEFVTPACGPDATVQQMEATDLANDAELLRWALDEAAALKQWKVLAERPQPPKNP